VIQTYRTPPDLTRLPCNGCFWIIIFWVLVFWIHFIDTLNILPCVCIFRTKITNNMKGIFYFNWHILFVPSNGFHYDISTQAHNGGWTYSLILLLFLFSSPASMSPIVPFFTENDFSKCKIEFKKQDVEIVMQHQSH
jgi:hypothetical protein